MVFFDSEKVVFAKMSIFNSPQIKNFIANEANSVLVYNDNPNEDMYTTYWIFWYFMTEKLF